MSALQEMATINAQFVGEMLGWDALSNPAQEEDNRGTTIVGLGEQRVSEQVEDRATSATAVIQDRCAMPIVWCLLWWQQMAQWTGQAAGM